jgi:hypothetical protein
MIIKHATRAIGVIQLALKAHAPTIMVAGGVVSMGAAVVTASRKTLYLEEVLADHVKTLDAITEGENNLRLDGYTMDKARVDRYKTYGNAGFALTKHYAVPGVLFIGGAALVFGGHRIMLKRNAAMALAFTTLQKAFAAYRLRAVESMGPEFDRAMMHGWKKKEILNEETGEVETVAALDWDAESSDPYARVFEQGESDMWTPDLGTNKDFCDIQRNYAQQLLNRRGYLYLSEVYQALGFAESPLSRLVGWKMKRLPDGSKDIPQVDFGLDTKMPDDWKFSREQAIYLDFNCQGFIIGGKVQKIMEQA